jgi:hypothetical protein
MELKELKKIVAGLSVAGLLGVGGLIGATLMLAAVDEVVNLAQVVPTKRSKPKAAAEAVNQTAQVALMKKSRRSHSKKGSWEKRLRQQIGQRR